MIITRSLCQVFFVAACMVTFFLSGCAPSSPEEIVKNIRLSDVMYWDSALSASKDEMEGYVERYAIENDLNSDITLDQALSNNAEIVEYRYEVWKNDNQPVNMVRLQYTLNKDAVVDLYFYTTSANESVISKAEIFIEGKKVEFHGLDFTAKGPVRRPSSKIEIDLVRNLFSNDAMKIYRTLILAANIHSSTIRD